jgi:hypothetical protein
MTLRPLEPGDLDNGKETICGTCHQVFRPELSPPCSCQVEQADQGFGFHPAGSSLSELPMDWYEALTPRCEGCGELQDDCNCEPSACDCDSCLERRGCDEEADT